jgi:hypothetical protein
MIGKSGELRKGAYTLRVIRAGTGLENWDEWCRRVVWYGNRRGAYLYKYNFAALENGEDIEPMAKMS